MISVILPIHNQADQLRAMVGEHVAGLAGLRQPSEVLLVLNGCTDESATVAGALAAADSSVQVIESPLAGWGRAVRIGLHEARGDILCYTNSARTSTIDLVRCLDEALRHPDTVVKGRRQARDNWKRRLGSALYNLECRLLFRLPTWDVNGTPKVFSRNHARLLQLSRDDDLIDLEFGVVCRRARYPIREIALVSSGRRSGQSTTRWRSALRMYRGALRYWQTQAAS